LAAVRTLIHLHEYSGNQCVSRERFGGVVCDGRLVAAVEEERFNRVKYAAGFPAAAIRYCLKEAGLKLQEIDHVAVPRNPLARLGTKLFYALRMPSFARGRAKVLVKFTGVREALAAAFESDPNKIKAQFHRIEHHHAHLASAFFVSPFERAALLSADGLGILRARCGKRKRESHGYRRCDCVSAFAGVVLHGSDAVPGLSEIWRRIQSDGLAAYGEPRNWKRFAILCGLTRMETATV